jgi:hypothetical protein
MAPVDAQVTIKNYEVDSIRSPQLFIIVSGVETACPFLTPSCNLSDISKCCCVTCAILVLLSTKLV